MAVPVASPSRQLAALSNPRPFIPVPPKRSIQFRFRDPLNKAANAGPHPSFQRIEPIVPKKKRSFRRFPRNLWYPFSWRDLHRRANADSV